MSEDRDKPLWAGRFSDAPSGELERFGASLPVDERMWREDIRGSIAHARMLAQVGVISEADRDAIVAGLEGIAADLEAGRLSFDVADAEDIHMAVESELTRRIGEAGGRLHTGRSRNDQVALDFRLSCMRMSGELREAALGLAEALLGRARSEMGVVMPGYTHLQPAQPILLSHHLLAYFWMLARDVRRFDAARASASRSPLGAAALAGTTYPLDREAVARELGMDGVVENSMDAVSDRDFALDLLYACAVCQVHLSRLCEELVLWSSAEFGFVEMDDAHSTGSSIMPQKKNPDFAELVRGKTGRVVGDLTGLLVVLKGIPLAYDKDLQEDKEGVFDAFDTVVGSLRAVTGMVSTMRVKAERMREASHEGCMAATDLADYLVGRGMPFREAHGLVGRIVASCVERGVTLQELSLDELRSWSDLFDEGALAAVDIDQVVARRNTQGGTGHEAVRRQLEEAQELLDELKRG
jgi:argininosuccinate lyase